LVGHWGLISFNKIIISHKSLLLIKSIFLKVEELEEWENTIYVSKDCIRCKFCQYVFYSK